MNGAMKSRGKSVELASPSPGPAIKMAPVLLAPTLPLGEAFQCIVGACLAHLAANRELLAEPGVEAVHQMRVAVRRLRSACALFEPVIGHARPLAVLQDELRWLGQCLGRVRDWDVLLTALPAEASAAQLLQRAETRRAVARRSLDRALAGHRFIALLRGLECLAAEIAAEADSHRAVRREAPQLLSRLDHRVRRAGGRFRKLSAKERHSLRKKLRKLHYAVGFLSSLFPRRQVARFAKRTKPLQDRLGDLNDIAVNARLSREIGRPARRAPATAEAKGLQASWRRFRKADRFWT
jgi:CHAD domain-containing protein